MGAKDSKRSACLSYEDAVKRMSDVEYKRVCEAFKRLAGPSALLNKSAFVQNVLGDGVPSVIAEWLYGACGGTQKGISQRDLICGLVLLTRGTEEEKVRFLWSLYGNEAGTWIQRLELEKALRLEGAEAYMVAQTLGSLFGADQHDNRVGYEQFKAYLAYNREATVLSKWLLICLNTTGDATSPYSSLRSSSGSNHSSSLPTFYQSLAGVTHLHERDIADLEKAFWAVQAQSPTSQLDRTALMALVSPPVPSSLCQGLFLALDENQDGHVDFKELCCGISAACRGPKAERMKFCFKIFDMDRDNKLNQTELDHVHQILAFISPATKHIDTETDETKRKLSTLPAQNQNTLSLEDFLMWAINHEETIDPLLQLLFEVGHVNLGLRPQCRHLERDIILGWRRREQDRGYRVGQYWYLIASEWWHNWMNYTTYSHSNGQQQVCSECGWGKAVVVPQEESNYGGSSASSNQSASTDSMGDLLLFKSSSNNDTASLASSSGVSSGSNVVTPKIDAAVSPPGPIDNAPLLSTLVAPPGAAVPTLTGEGGRLRTDITLCEGRDFTLVPDSLWKAIAMWYGGSLPLPRQVIQPPGAIEPELELYPLNLRILRHQQTQVSAQLGENKVPGRYLAHTAAFSRLATVRQVAEFLAAPLQRRSDEVRLWLVKGSELVAIEEDGEMAVTLYDLGVKDCDQLLLEVRNVDLTWPEELGALAQSKTDTATGNTSALDNRRATIGGNLPQGATGLHNLGNTCFMNAALQAVSNTKPLTRYFLRNTHLNELNTANPMGSRGQVARRYAELVRELWAATPNTRSVAPLKLRWCVSKHAPDSLGGGGQHDSQELLAWLLDQLHEDLNRVPTHKKIYKELKDSDGRPDEEVAAEAWRLHSARDASIITDLFYGQLKSKVTCEACKHESVRFDAFNVLSLPLPMENYTLCEVLVLRQPFAAATAVVADDTNQVPLKYGVRLPLKHGVARVRHLKRHLQKLCGVPAHRLLVTVLAHAQIHQFLQNDEQLPFNGSTTISRILNNAVDLVAFELPECANSLDNNGIEATDSCAGVNDGETTEDEEEKDEIDDQGNVDGKPKGNEKKEKKAACNGTKSNGIRHRQSQQLVRSPEVRASSSALCMPNILCFKTTVTPGGAIPSPHNIASAIITSPSPVRPFTDQQPIACNQTINNIDQSISSTHALIPRQPTKALPSYLIAVHRKTIRQETYFLHQQRSKPSLFGIPMLLACSQSTTGQDLYEDAWKQVARLLSPAPPDNSASHKLPLNHATDCDDSLGYEFPFTLRAVLPGGQICALCHWTNFCRGCAIPCCNDTELFDLCGTCSIAQLQIAIDWDPTALHLRYQSGREKEYVQHGSLFEARRLHTEPIDLDHCLRAFTQEERLEAKYHCGGCKSKQAATKKLQVWRLPPILIVHLKRFDRATSLDGDLSKWVKTHKVVNFPLDNFDPTAYLAAVPQHTILRHQQLKISKDATVEHRVEDIEQIEKYNNSRKNARERLESTSLQRTPIQDEHLHDYHQHHLQLGQDTFDLQYQLYAVVSHSGMMTGGHYVSYAHNPNGHWYCYNDSSCREVALDHLANCIDPSAAYLLFYERKGLDYRPYLPDLEEPHVNETLQEDHVDGVANADGGSSPSSVVADNNSVIFDNKLSVGLEATENGTASQGTAISGGAGDSSDIRRQFCRLQ